MIEFRLLGDFAVVADGTKIDLGRRQERCVLGLLALTAGRTLRIDRLVDLLWGTDPPISARATLHSYVARLRKRLTPFGVHIATRGAGYQAEIEEQQVDALRFTAGLARAQLETINTRRAAILADVLALWRGPLLADVADDRLRQQIGATLEEQRILGHELLAESELANGRHHQQLAVLADLAQQYPAREGLAALLIRARYRAGDIAGALATFEATRRHLSAELGLDPGRELTELHVSVLNRRDPVLLVARTAIGHQFLARVAKV